MCQPPSCNEVIDKLFDILTQNFAFNVKITSHLIHNLIESPAAVAQIPDRAAHQIELMHHAGDDQDDAATITDILTVLKGFENFLFAALFVTPDDIGVSLQTIQNISSFRKMKVSFSSRDRISHDQGHFTPSLAPNTLVMGDATPR